MLQLMSATNLIRETWRKMQNNSKQFWLATLLAALLLLPVTMIGLGLKPVLTSLITTPQKTTSTSLYGANFNLGLKNLGLLLAGYTLAYLALLALMMTLKGALAVAALRTLNQLVEGGKLEPRKFFGEVNLRSGLSYGAYHLFTSIYVMIGLILFIIPGIYLGLRYAFGLLLVSLDGLKYTPAKQASGDIIKGHYWSVLWRFIICGLMFFMMPLLILMVVLWSINVLFPLATTAATIILSALTLAFISIAGNTHFLLMFKNLKELRPAPQAQTNYVSASI